ncbi:MAG: proton-conducting transporter membrane subunit, partial [bacterium]|nr:proton-conducting transporter membrane subunit [bacterium]
MKNQRKPIFSFVTVSLSSATGMVPVAQSLFTGCTFEKILFLPFPFEEIAVRIDPLSAFFLLIVYLGSVLTTLYSIDYLKSYAKKRQFNLLYLSFNLLVLSMVLLPAMKNIFAFLLIWEAMSLSSFFAILFENEKDEAKKAALEYFIYMHIGFLMIMSGFLILAKAAGSYDILSFKAALNSPGIIPQIGFLLLFFGFGIKSGFTPFHSWLPKAHPASVSNVSGFMSGIMLKMGIYGILRFALMIDFPSFAVAGTVIAVSSVTALTGILYAMFEKDIKKLLAYSSIENMGIIGIGIGMMLAGKAFSNPAVMLLGLFGALVHSLNHSLFKPLLFFSSGSIY